MLAAIASIITTAIDRVWLWIFRSPILLFKSVFGLGNKLDEESLEITINSNHLKKILTQLDSIQAQQKQIIEELNTLKKEHTLAQSNLLVIDKTHQSVISNEQTVK